MTQTQTVNSNVTSSLADSKWGESIENFTSIYRRHAKEEQIDVLSIEIFQWIAEVFGSFEKGVAGGDSLPTLVEDQFANTTIGRLKHILKQDDPLPPSGFMLDRKVNVWTKEMFEGYKKKCLDDSFGGSTVLLSHVDGKPMEVTEHALANDLLSWLKSLPEEALSTSQAQEIASRRVDPVVQHLLDQLFQAKQDTASVRAAGAKFRKDILKSTQVAQENTNKSRLINEEATRQFQTELDARVEATRQFCHQMKDQLTVQGEELQAARRVAEDAVHRTVCLSAEVSNDRETIKACKGQIADLEESLDKAHAKINKLKHDQCVIL